MKLLTNREMELFRLALNQAVKFQELQSEMPVDRTEVAFELAKFLSFNIVPGDIHEMCEVVGV